jgi:hypothetical protein
MTMKAPARKGRPKVKPEEKGIATAVCLPPEMFAFLERLTQKRRFRSMSAAVREGVAILMAREKRESR